MTILDVRNGALSAGVLRISSENSSRESPTVNTVSELLDILRGSPVPELPVLKTTCSRLTDYLGVPTDRMTIDMVNDSRDGFRPFLEGRGYKENAVRSYVNHTRILLRYAEKQGWRPGESVPEAWKEVLAHPKAAQCNHALKHFSRRCVDPRQVMIDQVEKWADEAIIKGMNYLCAKNERTGFWRLLYECNCNGQTPICLLRTGRSVTLDKMPEAPRKELLGLLEWKQAEFSIGRPKGSRIRPVTANLLSTVFRQLYYFAQSVLGITKIHSLAQLVERDVFSTYVEWCINVRKVGGYPLQCQIRLLFAAVRQYPPLSGLDVCWWKELHDSIPVEAKSEQNRRKAQKCLSYDVLEAVPCKIRQLRSEHRTLGAREIAELVMHELLMFWLSVLPWRQKNLRECRIGGPVPNLYKSSIPAYGVIDMPAWIQQEQARNPAAQFWQFDFAPHETKPKRRIQAALPKQLIPLLEEYLQDHRPKLLKEADPGTLFVKSEGTAFNNSQITNLVSELTLRFGGKRVTPHLYRDIVAFTWLKAHPKDFLTVSKLLWHNSIAITIDTYGSQFNESSGVCAMEEWLEERKAKST